MKIYFLRHGIAADAASWKGNDADRPLTPEGRERMQREAKRLAKLGLDLTIVTSPFARAKETAEIVAARLDSGSKILEDARVATGFDVPALAQILDDHPSVENLILVGHEPTMSATIGRLIGSASVDLKKGGLACVELPDRSSMRGTLLWLVPPKVLLV